MFIAEKYVLSLLSLLKKDFGERLLYVGLQGSYLRGEENEDSDIDIMVVI
ncbi:MAG: nucleotidyltransferase domain-containing protein, partial [Clostridia bacterium]|nr:nucleotidyltransferase domain-containing protein [Clostridia bacterium]